MGASPSMRGHPQCRYGAATCCGLTRQVGQRMEDGFQGGQHLHSPMGEFVLHCPHGPCSPLCLGGRCTHSVSALLLVVVGVDVAPTVSLHYFFLLLGGRGTHSVSTLLLLVIGGTWHPQCLCTTFSCYWGDVAPTVSLHCFLLLLLGWMSHPQCLCTASCCDWGMSHPQHLCTASCLCIWGRDVAPTASLRCFLFGKSKPFHLPCRRTG